ncbi:MAG: DUF554 domain-containing protein [Clostridia bacterium]|nr:DUF554 domain-containing protein [Clostridia bacterium]
MIGVLTNTLTVLIGASLGLLLKRGIPEKVSDAVMKAIGLCTVFIGISGALQGENTLILILSMAIGTLIGAAIDIDTRFTNLVEKIEAKFKKSDGKTSVAEGFIGASLVFCVGAMTIVGSLQAGISGDNTMLFTKSVLDLISSFVFASALGIGVLFAAGFVFVFQGALVLLAQFVAPLLSAAVISEMTCVGSVVILALGLNLIGVTKMKIMNYLPAILLPILLCPLYDKIAAWIASLL